MDARNVDERVGRIVAGAADAIVFADREGTIRRWNAGAERIFEKELRARVKELEAKLGATR